jgi:hypothetical protein
MRKCLFVLIIALLGGSSAGFGQAGSSQAPSAPQPEKVAKANLTWSIIGPEGDGYGYDVYADGKMLIHQPGIPGQPGVKGFRTKADSEKVARLVVKKLKNKEMPPTVSEEELRKLKVIE